MHALVRRRAAAKMGQAVGYGVEALPRLPAQFLKSSSLRHGLEQAPARRPLGSAPRGRRATRTSTSLEPSPRDAIDQTSTRTGLSRKAAAVRAHEAGTRPGRRERGGTRGIRAKASAIYNR